ncbi:MAG: SDR family NAD(P)-dependent oxidoreductase [Thermoleophilaceae bacterium]
MRPLPEQTILVTGATDGLGRALAQSLAERGATLLVHGRDEERLAQLAGELGARPYRADLASLDEVRAMADELLEREERIHTLVNNAGIGTTLPGGAERQESSDGIELRFAVNYLSHYLLTRMLLPLVVGSAPARIVNVSSAGQWPIDFGDVMLEHGYEPFRAYAQSKLAQVMFTFDLAEELPADQVTANCLHPATFMPTKMVFAARGSATSTLEEGRDATLRLIEDPELDGVTGRYFNGTHDTRADDQAYDPAARAKLRELSDRLTRDPTPESRDP